MATGTATIDFGTGANEASVAVTGQTAITSTAKAEAWVMADDTSTDHTAADHRYLPMLCSFTCGTATDGVGFTVHARSPHKLTGRWSIRWVWSNN